MTDQLADQHTSGQLAVKNVRREDVVRYVDDTEREQTPIGKQRTERQEHACRYVGANAVALKCHLPFSLIGTTEKRR
jgi:hypothetical protein